MTLIDTGGTDVVDMLTTDHREMLELLRRIERTEDLDERRDIADTVIAEVMRHSVAEEMIVYPSIQEYVPGGNDEVEHDKEEHEEQNSGRLEEYGDDESRPLNGPTTLMGNVWPWFFGGHNASSTDELIRLRLALGRRVKPLNR